MNIVVAIGGLVILLAKSLEGLFNYMDTVTYRGERCWGPYPSFSSRRDQCALS